jgi:hypothetical protein
LRFEVLPDLYWQMLHSKGLIFSWTSLLWLVNLLLYVNFAEQSRHSNFFIVQNVWFALFVSFVLFSFDDFVCLSLVFFCLSLVCFVLFVYHLFVYHLFVYHLFVYHLFVYHLFVYHLFVYHLFVLFCLFITCLFCLFIACLFCFVCLSLVCFVFHLSCISKCWMMKWEKYC